MDEKKRAADDISDIVQSVIQATKHPDTTARMEESREEVYGRIHRKINSDTSRLATSRSIRRWYPYYWAAASVMLLVCLSYFLYSNYYSPETVGLQSEILWQETYVPKGEHRELALADGTVVTLNGGSSLRYPSSFANGRQVFLQGEAYFDVAPTTEQPADKYSTGRQYPFVVQSHLLHVKVLGTRFGFKAYQEDKQVVLTLESGSVTATPSRSEQSIMLRPNQQLTLDTKTGQTECREVNAADYTAWKSGVLVFREQTLEEIATTLERQFDVRIEITSDKLRNERYGARFKHGESVKEILDKLSQHRSWKYKIENGTIRIAPS